MKTAVIGILFVIALLAHPWQTTAQSADPPASAPLQLHQAPGPTQNSTQIVEIRDIKGPVPIPDPSRFLLPALLVLALLILAALFFFFLKHRRKPFLPASPPDVVALADLDQARSLMAQPLVYADRISGILRQYIESRFQIRSTRQTTSEFFSRLKNETIDTEKNLADHAGELQECMEQCDIAKFAHGTPNQEGMLAMDRAARTFIETTRQETLS